MITKREPSLTKAADPVIVVIGSTLDTSSGSVAFNGLENRGSMIQEDKSNIEKCWQANPNYPSTSEAQDVPPVASWMDRDPHIMCRWCHLQVRWGRGPIEYVDQCPACKCELAQFVEVPNA